jgi:hypothetical protein
MSWMACACEFCYCLNVAHSTDDDTGEVLCDACEMGEHEVDDDPEA